MTRWLTLPDVEAKTLFDTVASRLAEVEAGILVNILSDVEANILVDTLADKVAELEVETLENTPGDVETKAVVEKQDNTITFARRETCGDRGQFVGGGSVGHAG